MRTPIHRTPLATATLEEAHPETISQRVDDVHGAISATTVPRVLTPTSPAELRAVVARCAARGEPLTLAGGRHAMGGQAFRDGATLVDVRGLRRLVGVDRAARTVEVEAGIDWPELVRVTRALDRPGEPPLGIVQKQTGADRMTLGGSISANAHGRGLALPPLGAQVEALRVVRPDGRLVRCSRDEHPSLFRHVIGGYGLFGAIATVTLRLEERYRVRRRVELRTTDGLMDALDARRRDGFRFGDFQFAVDARSEDFLRRGVFSCYEPAPDDVPQPGARRLSDADWCELLYLAHVDKARAFELYAAHYASTDGQVYESDLHQLASYQAGYHAAIDARTGATCRGSEVITELYVPRAAFEPFLVTLRRALVRTAANVIYGTVRVIERDEDSALPWAREPWACLVVNLHVDHDAAGLAVARRQFRAAIDAALEHAGSFYLTYHRWATAAQLRAAYPGIDDFVGAARRADPRGTLRSDWLRHLERTLAG